MMAVEFMAVEFTPKPKNDRGFFENYIAHYDYLCHVHNITRLNEEISADVLKTGHEQVKENFAALRPMQNQRDISSLQRDISFFLSEKEKREKSLHAQEADMKKCFAEKLNFLTPFRDIHDGVDEILGATLFPLTIVVSVVSPVVMALKEMFHMLAIWCHILADDQKNHATDALEFAVMAIALPILALLSIIKFALSLITRSIATLVQSVKSQEKVSEPGKVSDQENTNRFCYMVAAQNASQQDSSSPWSCSAA